MSIKFSIVQSKYRFLILIVDRADSGRTSQKKVAICLVILVGTQIFILARFLGLAIPLLIFLFSRTRSETILSDSVIKLGVTSN